MNALDSLLGHFVKVKLDLTSGDACVDWAMDRLARDEEGDDADVALLAGARDSPEALELAEAILRRHGLPGIHDMEMVAGKYVVQLHDTFRAGEIDVESLDPIFTRLYYDLERPAWLFMLMRNCEYATDIPAFRETFGKVFRYIADLWRASASLPDFLATYDDAVSKSFDPC